MTGYANNLKYTDLLIISVGHIIGAGIFSIIGKVYKYAGNYSYLSIIISGLLMYWISLSYNNISQEFKSNDSEYKIIRKYFGEKVSFISGNMIIIGNILTCAVLAITFSSYFARILNINELFISICILFLCMFILLNGVNTTKFVSYLFTTGEVSTLIYIIVLSMIYIFQNIPLSNLTNNIFSNINKLFENPITNIIGIFIGAYLILFAYSGFETIIRISEETEKIEDIKTANKNSFIITTSIYTLISICLINVLSVKELGDSNSPMSDIILKITGNNFVVKVISIIATLSIFNTILLILMGNTRMMSSMYKNTDIFQDSKYKKIIDYITKLENGIPINSIIINVLLILIILFFSNNIVKLTSYSNLFLLLVPLFIKAIDSKYFNLQLQY